jgi:hypothetical protein
MNILLPVLYLQHARITYDAYLLLFVGAAYGK